MTTATLIYITHPTRGGRYIACYHSRASRGRLRVTLIGARRSITIPLSAVLGPVTQAENLPAGEIPAQPAGRPSRPNRPPRSRSPAG